MNITSAISKCIADLSLAKNTARTYQNGLNRFVEFLGEHNLPPTQEAGKLEISHFIEFMPWLDHQFTKSTANIYNSAAKALLNYLLIQNVIQINYTDSVRYQQAVKRSHSKHESKLPRWPKKSDVPKMLQAVHHYHDETPRRERNIALLEMLASTGCRINEVVMLDIKDVDLVKRTTVVMGKGSKERRVFFSRAAAKAIETYWTARKSRKANDPAFARHDRGAGHKQTKRMTTATGRNIVKAIAIVAGIDPTKFTPHYFRHAFAIRVLSETGNLALTQDLLGHADPKATRNYAKIEAEDLQKAHQAIFDK